MDYDKIVRDIIWFVWSITPYGRWNFWHDKEFGLEHANVKIQFQYTNDGWNFTLECLETGEQWEITRWIDVNYERICYVTHGDDKHERSIKNLLIEIDESFKTPAMCLPSAN